MIEFLLLRSCSRTPIKHLAILYSRHKKKEKKKGSREILIKAFYRNFAIFNFVPPVTREFNEPLARETC